MLRSPFPFEIRSGCALTTFALVVLTLHQQGYEKRNGAQCACLLRWVEAAVNRVSLVTFLLFDLISGIYYAGEGASEIFVI